MLELARSCPIVLSYTHKEPLEFPKIVSIECGNKPLSLFNNHTTFLSIQEYEREAIRHFSSTCTDTELANKLGISRKSLWENAGSITYRANKRKSLSSVFIGRLIIKCKNAKSVFTIKRSKASDNLSKFSVFNENRANYY